MIRIAILGDIGSGKSYVSRKFGYPVFNADNEVGKLYSKDKKVFKKLNKILPNYIDSFPINKEQIIKAVLANKENLKKIVFIVHREVRRKMNIFLKRNKNRKIVILDIPLFLENKLNKKRDILVFIQSNKSLVLKKIKKRKNFNLKILKKFKSIQLPLDYKKNKSQYIIKNDFSPISVKKGIKIILDEIL